MHWRSLKEWAMQLCQWYRSVHTLKIYRFLKELWGRQTVLQFLGRRTPENLYSICSLSEVNLWGLSVCQEIHVYIPSPWKPMHAQHIACTALCGQSSVMCQSTDATGMDVCCSGDDCTTPANVSMYNAYHCMTLQSNVVESTDQLKGKMLYLKSKLLRNNLEKYSQEQLSIN